MGVRRKVLGLVGAMFSLRVHGWVVAGLLGDMANAVVVFWSVNIALKYQTLCRSLLDSKVCIVG